MSNDPEQETFVDGLTEDLITDLSRSAGLFVIARNSTFAYKGRSVDVRLAARDLGVRYVIEGSARRAAGRVRINAQLIDAVGGDHIWAERYDSSLEDIFAVQDEVTAKIVEALVGRLAGQPARKRPTSLEAYDLCVRARGGSFGPQAVGPLLGRTGCRYSIRKQFHSTFYATFEAQKANIERELLFLTSIGLPIPSVR